MSEKITTPDIGAIVEFGFDMSGEKPRTHRVSAWLREATKPFVVQDEAPAEKLLDLATRKDHREFDTGDGFKRRVEWCLREEATHLMLSGVGGTIAPIEKCKVIGMVDWTEEQLASARASATSLGKSHMLVV